VRRGGPPRAGRRAGALLAAALVLAGCGEDRRDATTTDTIAAPPRAPAETPAPALPEAPPAEVELRETEYRLDPAQIRVDRPATLAIEVRNRGRVRHALEVEDGGTGTRTRTLEPGDRQVLRVELSKPGRYRWFCPVDGHARRGMRGSIAVARGGG
jgi:plastocyanin